MIQLPPSAMKQPRKLQANPEEHAVASAMVSGTVNNFVHTASGLQLWDVSQPASAPWIVPQDRDDNDRVVVEPIQIGGGIQGQAIYLEEEEIVLQDLVRLYRHLLKTEASVAKHSIDLVKLEKDIIRQRKRLRWKGTSRPSYMRRKDVTPFGGILAN